MSAFENATRFFHARESLEGWDGCKDYVEPGAAFEAQCEPLTDVTSVVADDDYTVTLTFEGPKPYPFEPFVGYNGGVVLQQAQMAECVGAAAQGCSEQNFAPVGTGPYMVTELRPEDTVTYAYNPNYRGVSEGKPFFGTVTIKGGGDAEAAARSVLEVGEAADAS